jgi:hypothetical protein
MPAKKKSPATKLKVELKDLKPKKDPKGGIGNTTIGHAAISLLCKVG